jgi:hypothetical protein
VGFIPHAVDRGFVVDERHHPRWTTFRRRTEGRVQIFDVQWDKYGRPRFRINFGTCGADGLRVDGQRYPADETLASWCPDAGTLQPRRGTGAGSWFRQDAPFLHRLFGRPALRDPQQVVDQLLMLFPELERYWDGSEVGPHLRVWNK